MVSFQVDNCGDIVGIAPTSPALEESKECCLRQLAWSSQRGHVWPILSNVNYTFTLRTISRWLSSPSLWAHFKLWRGQTQPTLSWPSFAPSSQEASAHLPHTHILAPFRVASQFFCSALISRSFSRSPVDAENLQSLCCRHWRGSKVHLQRPHRRPWFAAAAASVT